MEIFELFEAISATNSKTEKLRLLRENESHATKDLLKGTYDDRIVWLLPKGPVPFEPADQYAHPTHLRKEYKKFIYFAKGGKGDKMNVAKREKLFLGVLEGINPKDAVLVVKMINKEQLARGLTERLVAEAYPKMLNRR
jgi:hypothetical protein